MMEDLNFLRKMHSGKRRKRDTAHYPAKQEHGEYQHHGMENADKARLSAGLYRNGGPRDSRSRRHSAEERNDHVADSLSDKLAAGIKALALHLSGTRAAEKALYHSQRRN